MSNKIKRGGNGMFGRRKSNTWVKVLVWILVLGVLFYGGYYLGTALLTAPEKKPQTSETSGTSSEQTSQQPSKPAETPSDPAKETSDLILFCDSEILKDPQKRGAFIQSAVEQKAAAVAFTCKDANGKIWIQTDQKIAVKAKAVSPDAIDAKAFFLELEKAGLKGLPIVYTFLDPLASSKNPAMAIWYNNGIENYLWLDDFADKGGKAWLNPYHKQAQEYVLSISEQLYDAGFQELLFAGCEFGAAESNSSAVYQHKNGSHLDAMTAFVQACEKQAESKKAVCYFTENAQNLLLGNQKLGGNFLQTGAKHIAPVFFLKRLPRNLKVESQTFPAPEDDPAAVTKALMEAYAKEAKDVSFMPVFFDYLSIAKLQAGVLEKGTPYLLLQNE